jgi:localization factor PodJL
MAIRRLALLLAPVILLSACEALDDFARSVDDAAATIVPSDRDTSLTDAERAYRRGLAFLNGEGAKRDEAKAASYFYDAADKGSRDAAFQLGLMYQRGTGVPQNDGTALAWFEKAATLGHGEAQLITGQAYATARGTGKDLAWAARWYGKAADQGLAPAQHLLGMAYANGQGLPRDRVAAYTWLSLAAAQKDDNAARERTALAKHMSKAEIDQASRRVRAWHATKSDALADAPTVRFAQMALADLGFQAGPVDGQVGPRTRQAIVAYQARAGLPQDGVLDAKTIEKLKADRMPGSSVARSGR